MDVLDLFRLDVTDNRGNLVTKMSKWKRYIARKCCTRDKQRVVEDWLILAYAKLFLGDLPGVKGDRPKSLVHNGILHIGRDISVQKN